MSGYADNPSIARASISIVYRVAYHDKLPLIDVQRSFRSEQPSLDWMNRGTAIMQYNIEIWRQICS